MKIFFSPHFFLLWDEGNKLDMAKQREVSFEEADAFAKDNRLIYLEVPLFVGGDEDTLAKADSIFGKILGRFQRKRDKMSKKPFCERPTKFMKTSRFFFRFFF